jgi:hypothetical protein
MELLVVVHVDQSVFVRCDSVNGVLRYVRINNVTATSPHNTISLPLPLSPLKPRVHGSKQLNSVTIVMNVALINHAVDSVRHSNSSVTEFNLTISHNDTIRQLLMTMLLTNNKDANPTSVTILDRHADQNHICG